MEDLTPESRENFLSLLARHSSRAAKSKQAEWDFSTVCTLLEAFSKGTGTLVSQDTTTVPHHHWYLTRAGDTAESCWQHTRLVQVSSISTSTCRGRGMGWTVRHWQLQINIKIFNWKWLLQWQRGEKEAKREANPWILSNFSWLSSEYP